MLLLLLLLHSCYFTIWVTTVHDWLNHTIPAPSPKNSNKPRAPSQQAPAPVPNLHLLLCVWKPLKAHATYFIAITVIYSVVHFKAKEAHCEVKMQNPLVSLERFLALIALLIKSMPFIDEHFNFALLPFTTCPAIPKTRSLAALVAITQNVFLARSLWSGNSNLWFCHHGECCYTLVPQALCSIELLDQVSHMHWVNIQLPAQRISYPAPACNQCEFPRPRTSLECANQHLACEAMQQSIFVSWCSFHSPCDMDHVS